jgi:hypothetical protein
MRIPRGLLRAFAPALMLALYAAPSAAQTPDEAAVMEVVDRLFEAMRNRDGAVAASVFHPEARLISTGRAGAAAQIRVRGIDGFVDAVGQGGDPWNEPLFDPEVRVDQNLAHVWVFYHFFAGETFSHCGYDSFQLVRTPDGWKIVSLADTRRTEECEP